MASTSLILNNDAGGMFERIFYRAICIADPEEAEQLYKVYLSGKVSDTYWRDAFNQAKYGETALVSAIVNHLEMPFGAYVLERCEHNLIEISPWMYSSKFNRQEFFDKLFSAEVTEEYLLAQQRMLEVTAAFLRWLKHYEKKHKK